MDLLFAQGRDVAPHPANNSATNGPITLRQNAITVRLNTLTYYRVRVIILHHHLARAGAVARAFAVQGLAGVFGGMLEDGGLVHISRAPALGLGLVLALESSAAQKMIH